MTTRAEAAAFGGTGHVHRHDCTEGAAEAIVALLRSEACRAAVAGLDAYMPPGDAWGVVGAIVAWLTEEVE